MQSWKVDEVRRTKFKLLVASMTETVTPFGTNYKWGLSIADGATMRARGHLQHFFLEIQDGLDDAAGRALQVNMATLREEHFEKHLCSKRLHAKQLRGTICKRE